MIGYTRQLQLYHSRSRYVHGKKKHYAGINWVREKNNVCVVSRNQRLSTISRFHLRHQSQKLLSYQPLAVWVSKRQPILHPYLGQWRLRRVLRYPKFWYSCLRIYWPKKKNEYLAIVWSIIFFTLINLYAHQVTCRHSILKRCERRKMLQILLGLTVRHVTWAGYLQRPSIVTNLI